jgi:hypothetical protein
VSAPDEQFKEACAELYRCIDSVGDLDRRAVLYGVMDELTAHERLFPVAMPEQWREAYAIGRSVAAVYVAVMQKTVAENFDEVTELMRKELTDPEVH